MSFEDWLCYVEALSFNKCKQAICLLSLINLKLDISVPEQYKKAENAVNRVLKDKRNGDKRQINDS